MERNRAYQTRRASDSLHREAWSEDTRDDSISPALVMGTGRFRLRRYLIIRQKRKMVNPSY